jgi:TRAP-type transport system periplasmic protein
MKRRTFARYAAIAVAAIAPGLGTPAAAAEVNIRIGWATTDAETDAYRFAAHQLAAELEKRAPGRFNLSFFPNRQLGDEKEMVQGMQLGTVDAGLITNSIVANVEPSFQINDLPFLYASAEQAHRILDGELGQKLFDKLAKKNIVGLAYCESGFRNMINNVRPVAAPKDVEGVKYRVMQSPIFIGMYKNLGGTAMPMAWGDVFTAMQQGTIDGLEIPTWVVTASKLNEVSKYLSLTHHVYTATPLLVSARLYKKLGAEDQKTLKEAARAACEDQRKFNAKMEDKDIAALKEKGMEVNKVGGLTAFRDKMRPVYDEYRPKIGAELMDQWMAALAK